MLLAKRPTDGRDEFVEAVVLDDRAWPKDLDEFVSRHDGAGVLDEIQESVERLRGNFDATPSRCVTERCCGSSRKTPNS